MVNNLQLMNSFNDYINTLIIKQHKILEQTDNVVMMHRAQGAVATLSRLKLLRDEINGIK
jgi:hypothetical protein